jgi:hypothetical protein
VHADMMLSANFECFGAAHSQFFQFGAGFLRIESGLQIK